MIKLAMRLKRRGHAYEVPGGLYFDVSTFPRFGQLSRFSTRKMRRLLTSQDDARLDDPRRRSPLDFALWRRVTEGPTWPSPFGRGRPGWHLECSAMSDRHLGFPIDIHGGGSDLIYPHHECETAQSEAAHGMRTRFVGHWMHVAPMRLGGAKMSKSDGNMVFVRDALKKTSPQALRLYLLEVHYRRPFDHDEERLARAGTRADALAASLGRGRLGPLENDASTQDVLAALEDDLHAERAIRALERHSRRDLAPNSAASLRTIARKVLGIL
jgi:cysteinyl-tRNA synthetase